MLNYFIKRLLGMLPTLLIVAILVFLFVHLLPGDPARLLAGPNADGTVVAMVRHQLGLDLPLPQQFWHYLCAWFMVISVNLWPHSAQSAKKLLAAFCQPYY
jgi:ABC-type dipeptide/oligopeptide/nickel transport systems, permease components